MEAITRLPGGVAYVVVITMAIAAVAFLGRGVEARVRRASAQPAS
jgi:hypothetical protein